MPSADRNPKEVSIELNRIIQRKGAAPAYELLLLGVLAGVYIGFGAVGFLSLLAAGGPSPAVTKFLASTAFCVGLVLVLVPGSELFTGNILMSIGLVNHKIKLGPILRNWFTVYVGNFAGAIALAFMVGAAAMLTVDGTPTAFGKVAIAIAEKKLALSFGAAFCRGVLCNMLVCLAVIIGISSKTIGGKVIGIYLPVAVFVISGYEHSVANMFFLPAGLLARGTLGADFIAMFGNLIPVTLGNILGGLLVILLHPNRLRQLTSKSSQPSDDES